MGDHLAPVLDDPVLRETTVIAAIELAKDKILLVTREKGIFEFHGSQVVPSKTDADDLFTKQSYIDLAIPVSQGLFVVGVQRRGLVFLDASGCTQQTFLEEDGLPSGALDGLRLDRAGGLWVIGDTSLTGINPNRSISVFDHENRLPKSYVAATVRYAGSLYAVTGNGLYHLEVTAERILRNFTKSPALPIGLTSRWSYLRTGCFCRGTMESICSMGTASKSY